MGDTHSSVTIYDSLLDLLPLFDQKTVTETDLLGYFQLHAHLLRQNLEYAPGHYGVTDIASVVSLLMPAYLAKADLILANYDRFNMLIDRITQQSLDIWGGNLPDIVVVPCIGPCTAGGWADHIDGAHHIFIAMEYLNPEFAMDILIAHEIAHTVVELRGGSVLNGFYDEGFAVYMSAVICPAYDTIDYFYNLDEVRYQDDLAWIDKHRQQIATDARKPFVVLDDVHKLYFTSSYSIVPNIGYVIGYLYLKHLAQHYSLLELRTFAIDSDRNQNEFEKFILSTSL